MNAVANHARRPVQLTPVEVRADDVTLGKDVLELLSTAMYVDPMVVYREYVQNAADAIDAARATKLLAPDEGQIDITIDPQGRTLRIRDNGAGLSSDAFLTRMVALGGSQKRGSPARGFRGVGRLAGLGHAQELIFRSRAHGDGVVNEVRWDGRELRAHLADTTFEGNLSQLIASVVHVGSRAATEEDAERFFEVELARVPRGRSDKLLSPEDASDYLAQVAPVPFHPDFSFGRGITDRLKVHPGFSEVQIVINGGEALTRPHRDVVDINGRPSTFEAPVFIDVPSHDGATIAAVAWFLHHGYEGALSVNTLVKGLRLRAGNLQVGDAAILEGLFTETRFNSWSVGEVHLFDGRLVPNGRRDQFEQNAHYSNLTGRLLPTTRDIAYRCRTYSSRRSKLREFEVTVAAIDERMRTVHQGGMSESGVGGAMAAVETAMRKLEVITASTLLTADRPDLEKRVDAIRQSLTLIGNVEAKGDPLVHLPADDRAFYQRMIDLIFTHSANQVAAKSLVDRILEKELGG